MATKLKPCRECNGPAVDVGGQYITCGAAWNSDCSGHDIKTSRTIWNLWNGQQS